MATRSSSSRFTSIAAIACIVIGVAIFALGLASESTSPWFGLVLAAGGVVLLAGSRRG